MVLTGHEFGEGGNDIAKTLQQENIKASFFFTGKFYNNPAFKKIIERLKTSGHYLGPHSDQHLLYCDWTKRDSLLVTKDSFAQDITQNISAMRKLNLPIHTPQLFVPSYEWWNDSIALWSREKALTVFSFTPGIRTNADYSWPEMGAA